MNKKILATILALGMVLVAFSMIVPAAEEEPTPHAVPTVLQIDGVAQCIATDNQNVAFAVAGWCDVPVQVEVEVSTVADFAIGTGTNFVGTDGVMDNFASGVFRVDCIGLLGSTTYHYRVELTNGGDTIYWPSTLTTASTTTTNIGTVKSNLNPFAGIVDSVSSTDQYDFLGLFWITDAGGVESFPLSTIGVGTNFLGVTGDNWRSSVAPYDYLQDAPTSTNYWGMYGRYVAGVAPDNGLWWSDKSVDTQVGNGVMNFAYPTYPYIVAGDPTATATGPTGTSTDNTPDVTYTTTDSPASVDIYYSIDSGTNWVYYGTDADATSPYTGGVLADDTYDWLACPTGGNPTDPVPVGGEAVEAGSYTIDTTGPTATPTPADGLGGVALALGTYVIDFNEPMNTGVGTLATDTLPAGAGWSWNGNQQYRKTALPLLTAETTYYVELNGDFTDALGNAITGDYDFNLITVGVAPVATFDSISVDPYIGVLPDDVVLYATGDDSGTGGSNIVAMQYRVDGGAWVAMTPVDPLGPIRQFSANLDLHGWNPALSPFDFDIQASDGQWSASDTYAYAVSDTTDPLHGYDAASPADGASRNTGSTVDIYVNYQDFTDYTVAEYQINPNGGGYGAWTPMNLDGTWIGSFGADFSFQVTLAADGYIDYQYRLTDGAGNTVTGAERTINFATAAAVDHPYTVAGYMMYYDGTSAGGLYFDAGTLAKGTYDPGSTVAVTWYNVSAGNWETKGADFYAGAQYSCDLNNVSDGTPIFVNVTSGTINPGQMGYNITTSDIVAFPMGVRCDPMAAIPYNIEFVAATIPVSVVAGNNFNVDYEILDVNNVRCLGYFTYTVATPEPTQFWSSDPLFVMPADEVWDGTTVENGIATATIQLNTGGNQWINVSEGVAAANGPYAVDYDLTPWGAVAPALKDWANVTILVIAGAFQWNLVAGWNMICVPMDPINDGVDPGTGAYFGAFDCLREIEAQSTDTNTQIARKTAQVGGVTQYGTFDYGMLENDPADFATDYTAGYWVYATIPWVVTVQALNLTSSPGVDDARALPGGEWTMVGFTHNETWTAAPTAVEFTDGTFGVALGAASAGDYLTVSWFNQGNQLYTSYVTTTWFPGIPAAAWTYDNVYAYGWWIYVDNGVTITFDRLY